MIRTRVIPSLLLKGQGLVKTVRFNNPMYIGDPVNAVKIFNEKEVHELVFLDITATAENRPPRFDVLAHIASECFMPLCYGGGIKTIEDIQRLFTIGVEKVVLNSAAVKFPTLIRDAATQFGSQSIVVSIDAKKNLFGKYSAYINNGRTKIQWDPIRLAEESERLGAGEILINSIDQDGMMTGYDIQLIKSVSDAVKIPVIACGGAGQLADYKAAVSEGGASAVAAGSMFVFYGKHRAVLINFPDDCDLKAVGLK